jgi:serine/threonine protein kinase
MVSETAYYLPEPGDVVGCYRILGRLGAGGMGVVFDAVNLDTEGAVALKWLHPSLFGDEEAAARLRLEAKAMGRIQHPNLVAVHAVGEHEGQVFVVMERLRGASLRSRLEQGSLAPQEACRILSRRPPITPNVAPIVSYRY